MRASFTFSRHDAESNSELKSEFASGSVVFLIFPPACCSKIPETPANRTRSLRPAALPGVAEAAPAEEKRLTGEAMLLMTLERNGHENCRTDQRVLSQFCKFRRQIKCIKIGWQEWQGSNLRPPVLEATVKGRNSKT